MEQRPRKLLDQVSDAIRRKHYSPKTGESYVTWIKGFILFHNKKAVATAEFPPKNPRLTPAIANSISRRIGGTAVMSGRAMSRPIPSTHPSD
ncbi:MAG: phage integrase N-terminal SAM-like domain-containing protein [Chloroflexi bacterium]|nr:phage integrase N-terminal SAM-like domain-containing protein [Chloroflexota bacterium]